VSAGERRAASTSRKCGRGAALALLNVIKRKGIEVVL
jgi:hypothetical protein